MLKVPVINKSNNALPEYATSADYRGDIGLIVQNNGFEPFTVQQGDKIGQGIIYKCEQAEFTLVDELDKTERGEGGYGHTGVRN